MAVAQDQPAGEASRPDYSVEIQLEQIELQVLLKQYEKVRQLLADARLENVLERDRIEDLPEAEREKANAERVKRASRPYLEHFAADLNHGIKEKHLSIKRLQELQGAR